MPAPTERPESSTPATPATTDPIFVDPTGRRLRRGKLIGTLVMAALAAYVGVMLVAFLSGSTVATPTLPAPGHDATSQQSHR